MEHILSVEQAIKIAGGVSRLALLLGVQPPTVHEWKSGKRQVPAERCPQIERVTAGAVTCEQLRPDMEWSVIRSVPRVSAPIEHGSAQGA
ncbi:MAG: helix-turn-helix domain-containing protein [Betaproteobacteria bacterium]